MLTNYASPLELRRNVHFDVCRVPADAQTRSTPIVSSALLPVDTLNPPVRSRRSSWTPRTECRASVAASLSSRSRRRRVPLSFLPPVTYREPDDDVDAFLARPFSIESWDFIVRIVGKVAVHSHRSARAESPCPCESRRRTQVPRPSLPER